MKTMLIIQPHWPPSNLVGVHRVRLVANELHNLGWKALVLAIDERDYEEPLSPEMTRLVNVEVEVIKVRAASVKSFFGRRLIGDLGLRGYKALRNQAGELLRTRSIDFIWFSLPSWYPSLMGYGLKRKFGVHFGLDYRDPWVYEIPRHMKGFNRATITITAARILEPLALRNVSLVSGVSDGYVEGVRSRNKNITDTPVVTFQMGFRKEDHFIELPNFQAPINPTKKTYVYAGAHWPMGAPLFTTFLRALAQLNSTQTLEKIEFLFIGTGNTEVKSLQLQAEELGLQDIFREIPERQSYLEIQQILRNSDGAILIGSPEPHYSASKIFQCLLTTPRIFGFFHPKSEAKHVLDACNANHFFVPFDERLTSTDMIDAVSMGLSKFIDPEFHQPLDLKPLKQHTSLTNARKLINSIELLPKNLRL